MNRCLASLAVVFTGLTASGSAVADEPAQPTEIEGGETESGFPPPPPPPAGKGIPTPVHADPTRVRGGASLAFGAYVLPDQAFGLAGIQGRVGAQFVDMFGLYAMPSVSFGLGESMVRLGVSLVPELTVEDLFFIGIGPELQHPFGIGDSESLFDDSIPIGVRMRTGFAFGSKRPGRRHAFTLAFDAGLDFYDDKVGVLPTLSLGYDAF